MLFNTFRIILFTELTFQILYHVLPLQELPISLILKSLFQILALIPSVRHEIDTNQ